MQKTFDEKNNRRKSIRLPHYDYSQNGAYFITICIKNRACFFGKIENGKMQKNELGEMAEKFWYEITNSFGDVFLDEFVVMPNHIHGIVIIECGGNECTGLPRIGMGLPRIGTGLPRIGTGLPRIGTGLPRIGTGLPRIGTGLPRIGTGLPRQTRTPINVSQPPTDKKQWNGLQKNSLGSIVNHYKGKTKKWANTNNHEYFSWQRNYHEHIIRNEKSFERIAEYIKYNPQKWEDDMFRVPF